LHRRSLPPFFNLPTLYAKYSHNLPKFVRTIRQKLLLHARRVHAVMRLKEVALAAGRVGDVTEEWTNRVSEVTWDVPVEVVSIKWGNGVEGLLRVEEAGMVGKVIVKDAKGRRKRDVERVIGEVSLEGITSRIGWN
jgi:Cenp-O kinetochore centromere component